MSNLVQYRRDRKPLPHELLFMYRQRAGLTQVELAELLDLKSSKMMQLWENGYRLPAASRLKKLIEVYYRRTVFTHQRERQEVHELWTCVKDAFDARTETYQTYPIFDELWFDSLQNQEEEKGPNRLKPGEFEAAGPLSPAPDNPAQLVLTRPNNLPAPTTLLIGRDRDVEKIVELLQQPEVRLLTVTGPGGIGKTRLAIQAGSRLLGNFAQGIFFVALAAINDPALVLAQIAEVLAFKESGELLSGLQTYLRNRQILLVLDNFEQVTPAGDHLIALLEAAPDLKLLVTSRVVLRLYGEQEYNVAPLQLPEPDRFDPAQLAANASVKLLVERARQFRPDFILTEENAPALAWICLRLEGLPLALELASGWLKLFSPQLLLDKLEQSGNPRLQLLTGGPRNLAARQQTLRNTLEWSYRLLEPFLQDLFGQLAIFRGGGSFEAVETICSSLLSSDFNLSIFEGISRLVDHNLIHLAEVSNGGEVELRFEMLETIREYGLEKLAQSSLEDSARQAHATYYLAFLKKAQPNLHSSQQPRWLDRLERDHPNLRAALDWLVAAGERDRVRAEEALEMGIIMAVFWNMHGHLTEGRKWLRLILAKFPDTRLDLRARLLNNGALLASRQNDTPEATRLLEEALVHWRKLDDRRNISLALNNLGIMAFQRGDLDQAQQLYSEGLALKRELADPRGLAVALNNMGELLIARGKLEEAQALFQESFSVLETLGDSHNMALARLNLGKLALLQNRSETALPLLLESLEKLLDIGDKFNLAENLEELACCAILPGQEGDAWAVRLAGAAATLRDQIGAPSQADRRNRYEQMLAVTRANLSPDEWQESWKDGAQTPLEQLGKQFIGAAHRRVVKPG